jgi:hypothetical protein
LRGYTALGGQSLNGGVVKNQGWPSRSRTV